MLAVLAPTRYYRFFPAFPTPGVSTIMHDFPRPNLAFGKASRQLYGTTRPTLLVRSQSVCGLRGRPTLNSESAQDTDSTCSDDDYRTSFLASVFTKLICFNSPSIRVQHRTLEA